MSLYTFYLFVYTIIEISCKFLLIQIFNFLNASGRRSHVYGTQSQTSKWGGTASGNKNEVCLHIWWKINYLKIRLNPDFKSLALFQIAQYKSGRHRYVFWVEFISRVNVILRFTTAKYIARFKTSICYYWYI